jgi:hypothetical protein
LDALPAFRACATAKVPTSDEENVDEKKDGDEDDETDADV